MNLVLFGPAVSKLGFDPDDMRVIRLFFGISKPIGGERFIDADQIETVLKNRFRAPGSKSTKSNGQGISRGTLMANLSRKTSYVAKLQHRRDALQLMLERETDEIRRNELQIRLQKVEAELSRNTGELEALREIILREQDKILKSN